MNIDHVYAISLTLLKVAAEGPPGAEDLSPKPPAPATPPPAPVPGTPDQTQLLAESKRLSEAMLKGEAFKPEFTQDWADKDKWLGTEQSNVVNKWFNPLDDAGKPRALTLGETAALQARMERMALEKEQAGIEASPYATTKFQLEGDDYKGRQLTPAEIVKERIPGLAGQHQADPTKASEYQKALDLERAKTFKPGSEHFDALVKMVSDAIAKGESEAAAQGIKQLQATVDEAAKNNPTGVTDWLKNNWETLLVPGGLLLAAFGGNSMTTMVGLAAAAYGGYNLYGRYNYLQSPQGSAVAQMALKDAAAGKVGSPETLAQLKAMGPGAEAAYHDALFAVKFGYVQDMFKDKAYDQGTKIYNQLNPMMTNLLDEQKKTLGVLPNDQRRAAAAAAAPAAPKP
jgi:hypothetical protein